MPTIGDDSDRRIRELEAKLAEAEDTIARLEASSSATNGNEQIYRQLVELSPDAVLVYDSKRVIRYINQAGAMLYGASRPEDMVGLSTDGFVHAAAHRTQKPPACGRSAAEPPHRCSPGS